jgi:hypothetical protein
MTDPVTFSDAFLATCVDEYCKRAFAEVRRYEDLNKQTVYLHIDALQYNHEADITIKHKVQVGDSYDNNGVHAQVLSDNCIRGAHLCVMRLVTDLQSPPKTFPALLIEHQAEPTPVTEQDNTFMQEDIVDGECAELDKTEDQGTEQVSSFDDGPTGAN